MSFAYVLNTLRRRWLVVLLAVLLGALGGAAYAELTPDRYDATTSLVVSPVISNPLTGSREDVNIRTEQEILGSREVARHAADSLDITGSGERLRSEVSVAAPMGSQILQVTVRAESPQEAAEGADAIADAYLELRQESSSNLTQRYLEGVDQQIEDLQAEPSSPTAEALIETLQQQRTSVTPADQEPGRIIGAAETPSEPSGPGMLITVAGAAAAGLLLGIAAAVLRERLDPAVRSADRLELSAGPLAVVASEQSDEQFWARLADEAVRRARVDPASEPVRVLLHAASPMQSRIAAGRLNAAVRWILEDPGTPWGGAEDAVEEVSGTSAGCAVIVPSGRYRTSLVSAARRSDVAVIAATPRTALKDLTELVGALRECGIEVVVGLAEAPVPPPSTVTSGKERPAPQRHRATVAEQHQVDPALVTG
ncbi:MAG TPA: Wzz/FepE/Etk N-terminal domain-containing protein [Brachybacterium sp.]|nr:Wzz/FepE/Etk N-terminal domain-containing protein [Brachybacterium sp.]